MKAAVKPVAAAPRHAPAPARPALRTAGGAPALRGLPNGTAQVLRAPTAGAPLAGAVQAPLERSLGVALDSVRVHGDPASRAAVGAAGARAITIGPRIFLGPRESGSDLRLMAHEAAHVVQQQDGAAVQRLGGDTGALEREAAATSAAVARGEPATVVGRTAKRPLFLFEAVGNALGTVAGAVGDVIGTALGWVRDHANAIPGYRLLGLILRRDPLSGAPVVFSAANLLRAVLELHPVGTVIRVALDRYGILDQVGSFIEQQIASLAGVVGAIGGAVRDFLGSLGPLDIIRPGAVIARATRLIVQPIAQVRAFIGSLTEGIATFVREAILRPLAELASRTRAWDLLCAVLGRNPITGEAVPRTAETLIGGFMKLIGQDDVWENIKRGNAIARAWAWFQGTLAGVLAFVAALPAQFLAALRSLSIADLVAPLQAFGRIAATFGAFVGQFLGWAGAQVLSLLEIIFEVVAPAVMPYLRRAAGALQTIFRNPVGFIGNLVRAGIQGFRQFAGNFLTHLRAGLVGWLTGTLAGTGVYIPQGFTLMELVKFVVSVLGVTWANIRAKLVRVVGEAAVGAMEAGFDLVRTLVTRGPAAAWQQIAEGLTNLRDMVIEQVMAFVRSRIVQVAITQLLASLNPAGAFITAILAIYNTVMFLVERLRQIAAVAASVIDAIAAIAAGVIGPAAARVERTMAGLLPLVIAFLARLARLGDVGQVVTRLIDRVRAPIDRALDRVVAWLVAQARRLGRFFGPGRGRANRAAAPSRAGAPVRVVEVFSMRGTSHRMIVTVERGAATILMASAAGGLAAKIDALIPRIATNAVIRPKERVINKLHDIKRRASDFNERKNAYARSLGEDYTMRPPPEDFIRDYTRGLASELVTLANNYNFRDLLAETLMPNPLPSQRYIPEPVRSQIRAKLYERGSQWHSVRAAEVRRGVAAIDAQIATDIHPHLAIGQTTDAQQAMRAMKAAGKVLDDATLADFVLGSSYVTPRLPSYAVDHDPSLAEHWARGGNTASDGARQAVTEGRGTSRLDLVTARFNSSKSSRDLSGELQRFKRNAWVSPPFVSATALDIAGSPTVDCVTIDSHSLTDADGTPFLPSS